MSKQTILVTGGTGFIGSHTVVELINQGYDVHIIDNLSNSRQHIVDDIEQITGTKPSFTKLDLCNAEECNSFFSQHTNIKSVIHFAALKAVGESVEQPLLYYNNNLSGLINILNNAQQGNIENFVFSSSCSVYGEPDSLPISESAPLKEAESPYANTKRISEDILRDFCKVSELKTIALRYFNPIGAHSSALIGEYPLNAPTNLMPVITQTAIGIREKLLVNGTDYNTPDGSCIRDYIHVVDLAKAHLVALERLIDKRVKSNYEIFNLGTGKGTSVLEMIHTFEEVTGVKLNYHLQGRRAGDVVQVFADTKYANDELGWKSNLDIKEMISSAWKWEQALAKK
ncbi:MAG: UDP-glucose 4-epimerase GalE [Bacteroidia bacterium]|nr:UDP-glucose 4-epimerase GalE [Bacteroidia bacterium]NNC84749.1 UDP-glucose 4-epimerase GalE [Bacteroidia bacterium]NNM15241.1 UDP-glucose 4-epimerase GalE [Bacteroidia bacterium]